MKKKLNLNELIWFLILMGFTCYFYRIINTNKLTLFVHPKMVKYVKFALYFFIVLVIFQGKNILSFKKTKRVKLGYMMFLIPLLLGFLLKPVGISADTAINKGFSLTSQLKINTLKHKHSVLEDGTEVCEHDGENTHFVENTNVAENSNVALKNPIESNPLLKEKTINMTSENFINTYEEIYGSPHNYIGRSINMKGFIYKQKGLNKAEFILSRIVVSCCAADAQIVGILCDYSEEKIFPESTWVNIEGTLGERDYKDAKSGEISVIPIIKVSKVEKLDVQNNDYIYN
ncbi:TIGR03943 family putative permease subunit [Clostridium sp. CF012]|uniref:TIGR03943 family putative permease subunit n=1 Tax=Clostridium sp. CF012 TaxID=2843319 RepID=UPI001C0D3BA4|nr:TIGR03943 family protein [Clostridium sp. CF012]MBU3143526.1 TIGR03943 family protein [Clostridium sp. CF012]